MKRAEPLVVMVDADLEDIVPGFLEGRRKDVIDLRQALRDGNYETVRIIGHTMKGSGGGYGFQGITEIGRQLESAAEEKNREAVRHCTEELADYLERLQIIYQ